MSTSVWYQVIGTIIFPLDVIDETPKTIVVIDSDGAPTRILKNNSCPSFPTLEEAKTRAIRNAEDAVKHHEKMVDYHRGQLERAYLDLEILRNHDQTSAQ